MTPPATGSGLLMLPATVAGLQTAISTTTELLVGHADRARRHDGHTGHEGHAGNVREQDETLGQIAEHLREAAETLASSAAGGNPHGLAATGRPAAVTPAAEPDLAQMCSDCITLAVEVLGNEAQDLSPFDVLALTRCVTALCAARTCAQELAA